MIARSAQAAPARLVHTEHDFFNESKATTNKDQGDC
jgi:hypothetical protein